MIILNYFRVARIGRGTTQAKLCQSQSHQRAVTILSRPAGMARTSPPGVRIAFSSEQDAGKSVRPATSSDSPFPRRGVLRNVGQKLSENLQPGSAQPGSLASHRSTAVMSLERPASRGSFQCSARPQTQSSARGLATSHEEVRDLLEEAAAVSAASERSLSSARSLTTALHSMRSAASRTSALGTPSEKTEVTVAIVPSAALLFSQRNHPICTQFRCSPLPRYGHQTQSHAKGAKAQADRPQCRNSPPRGTRPPTCQQQNGISGCSFLSASLTAISASCTTQKRSRWQRSGSGWSSALSLGTGFCQLRSCAHLAEWWTPVADKRRASARSSHGSKATRSVAIVCTAPPKARTRKIRLQVRTHWKSEIHFSVFALHRITMMCTTEQELAMLNKVQPAPMLQTDDDFVKHRFTPHSHRMILSLVPCGLPALKVPSLKL